MRILLKRDPHLHWLLHWSPNGRKWYPINDKRIIPIANGRGPDAFKAFREAMNRVYRGEIEEFDGVYIRELKQLGLMKN